MSYWVYLNDAEGATIELPAEEAHSEGGTYVLGGTNRAELNITYNYSQFYLPFFNDEGLNYLSGKTAQETIPLLEEIVSQLGTDRFTEPHYVFSWDKTPEAILREYGYIDWSLKEHQLVRDAFVRQGYLYDTGGYWKATSGNAGYALSILLRFARCAPQGIWDVS